MDQLLNDSAVSVALDSQPLSKKRSRPDDEHPSPTDAPSQHPFPDAAPIEVRHSEDPVSHADAKDSCQPDNTSLSLPDSATRRPSASVVDSASIFSLPEGAALSEPFSPSPSVPSLSTGPRGSLSPPYMFSGPARPPDSPAGPSGGGGDGQGDGTEEEQAAVAQAEEGSIIVDSDDMATDAGYGSDNNSTASTSLAESVRDYIYENGRRYHKFREGRYNFPNDDVECVPTHLTYLAHGSPSCITGHSPLTGWAGNSEKT